MAYVASLDMGSETMIMALAEKNGEELHLLGVESVSSQGITRGRITDKLRAKASVQHLLELFENEYKIHIESLNVALPATILRQVSDKESISFSRNQTIAQADLEELKKQCNGMAKSPAEKCIAILPASYELDKEVRLNPVGLSGRRLDAYFQVYVIKESELNELTHFFSGLGIGQVKFFPAGEALMKSVTQGEEGCTDFAIVDLGADSTKIVVVKEGLLVYDSELPIGGRSIDGDLNAAFSIRDLEKARNLKHTYGMALCAACKKQQVTIPDTRLRIEQQNLALVEQSRLEEILEGAIFQIQRSGYYKNLAEGAFFTGGGSRISGVGILMERLSGFEVFPARATAFTANNPVLLQVPEFMTALGLLRCGEQVVKSKGRLEKWFGGLFKS